jgi:pimeloyl-ACP methyl ester carboxylesterase
MTALPERHSLPEYHWGDPGSGRTALLVHGLTSSGATWWHLGKQLAAAGWYVTAVDLRGNGTAPTAERYTFADYAGDLPAGPWSVVIGHSLGGTVAVVAAVEPGFTQRLVLLDPALELVDSAELLEGELAELQLDDEGFRRLRPTWHPLDIEHKAAATRLATARMVERTIADNDPWSVLRDAARLAVPTLLVGGDPAVYSMLEPRTVDELLAANDRITYRVVAGSGHSPHRDRPEETTTLLLDWLAAR